MTAIGVLPSSAPVTPLSRNARQEAVANRVQPFSEAPTSAKFRLFEQSCIIRGRRVSRIGRRGRRLTVNSTGGLRALHHHPLPTNSVGNRIAAYRATARRLRSVERFPIVADGATGSGDRHPGAVDRVSLTMAVKTTVVDRFRRPLQLLHRPARFVVLFPFQLSVVVKHEEVLTHYTG